MVLYLPAGRPSIPSEAGLAKTVLIIIITLFLRRASPLIVVHVTTCRVGYGVIELFVVVTDARATGAGNAVRLGRIGLRLSVSLPVHR